jgi:ribosomal protein S18 acetylase RimI-like enzyme
MAPAVQGRGHGTALVRAAEQVAVAAGHRLIGLAVADDNRDPP